MITKYGLPLLAVGALVFAVISVMRMTPVQANNKPPMDPPKAESFLTKVGAVGLVEASSENVSVSLPVPGLVTKLYVETGDRVRKGQPLFSLDDRDLRAELKLRESTMELAKARLTRLEQSPRPEEIPPAEARVREAEAQLSDAKVQLDLIESVRDKRAIRVEDLERRKRAVQAAEARVSEAKAALALLKAGTWRPDLDVARAEVAQAQQNMERIRTEIERLTVTAPMDGQILKSNVRVGEYAAAGPLQQPLMVLGTTDLLHVRADVDERDAHRVKPDAKVLASVRGDAGRQFALKFVRFEPLVIPKKNLNNEGGERVDSRVLQVIYALEKGAPVYTGQQMDVFIEAAK